MFPRHLQHGAYNQKVTSAVSSCPLLPRSLEVITSVSLPERKNNVGLLECLVFGQRVTNSFGV